MASVAMMLGACSSEPDIPVALDDVTLRLTVQPQATASRAYGDADSDWEDPSGEFEQIHTMRILIFRGSSALTDEEAAGGKDASATVGRVVEYNKLVMTSKEGFPLNDNLEFKVWDNESKRIYIIANEQSLRSPDGKDNTTEWLDAIRRGTRFDTSALDTWTAMMPGTNPTASGNLFSNVVGVKGLPLTEVFDVPVMRGSKGRTDGPDVREGETQSVTLFLTRAAAKATFRVKVDAPYAGTGVNVTGIRFNGINWSEYVFPHQATYVPEKYDGAGNVNPGLLDSNGEETERRYISSFATPARTVDGGASRTFTGLSIPIKAGTDTSLPPFYFCESKFANGGQFSVSVQLDGQNWLDAKPLTDNILTFDGQQAIARNTHLRVDITFGHAGITWTAIEAPYNSVDLRPDFGLTPKD